MKPFRVLSAVEQLAAHLREEILGGALGGGMPGVGKLVRRLGAGTQTVVAALEVLKQEGLLEGHGERRRNRAKRCDEGSDAGFGFHVLDG